MLRIVSIVFAMGAILVGSAAWASVPGDCDGNGVVDGDDVAIASDALGSASGDSGFVAAADMDGDGVISASDLGAILSAAK